MDNQRLLLWAALGFLLLQVWTSWQIDYGPKPAPAPVTTADSTNAAVNPGAIDQSESAPIPTGDDIPAPVSNNAVATPQVPEEGDTAVATAAGITVTHRHDAGRNQRTRRRY